MQYRTIDRGRFDKKNRADSVSYLLSSLLWIFAAVNLFILIFYNYVASLPDFDYINPIYTALTALILLSLYLKAIFAARLSSLVLRKRIPDLLILILAVIFYREPIVFQLCLLGRQSYLAAIMFSKSRQRSRKISNLSQNAAIFVLLSFFITILVGTILLLLPVSTAEGNVTSLTGALFTATSATCVTGLIVYDTGTHFSTFGQVIILLLFQIGGLGIMTISTSFAILTGQKLSFRGESIMQDVIEETNKFDTMRLIKNIVLVTLFFELFGVISLYSVFSSEYTTFSRALFSSVFHSVSSFCNAGFSLYSDSFTSYRSNWLLNISAMVLIVFGGIGFSVLVDLKRNIIDRFKPKRFSLHTKIVLLTTLFLIILGFVLFFITEYNNSMENFALRERLLGSMFQSVTTRTAGFNTVDTGQFSNSSALVSLFMMFVGASPGSTGGGIKTTSLAIIILSVIAILFGNKDVILFKRKIRDSLIRRVMALFAVSITLLFSITVILMMVEPFSFIHIVFESFSAFGTVGLSMGITPYLSDGGRVLVTFLMYFGRVGPLTFIYALSRTKLQNGFAYSEEKVSVG